MRNARRRHADIFILDARHALWMHAPQTASFSVHPAVSVDDFRHWMQRMPEGCIIASSDLNIPAI